MKISTITGAYTEATGYDIINWMTTIMCTIIPHFLCWFGKCEKDLNKFCVLWDRNKWGVPLMVVPCTRAKIYLYRLSCVCVCVCVCECVCVCVCVCSWGIRRCKWQQQTARLRWNTEISIPQLSHQYYASIPYSLDQMSPHFWTCWTK